MRAGFPTVDFDYFKRDNSLPLYKIPGSIMMIGKVGDSVFAYYITKKNFESIKICYRYRYTNTKERGDFYYIKNEMFWAVEEKHFTVGYVYLGSIREIELTTIGYMYEILLTEYINKKVYVLADAAYY